jgi:oligopeptide transport system substrate-binding protein
MQLTLSRPTLRSLLPLLGLVACVAGCDRYEQGDFAVVLGTEPQSLDPALTTGVPDGRVIRALFEGLTTSDPYTLEPLPGIAESWEVSEDGRVYTFHLRPAQWSDGVPLTASDFDFSWERVLRPETGAEYGYMLWYIAGARAYQRGESSDWSAVGTEVLDPRTFRVTLESPTPFFLQISSFFTACPVPAHRVRELGDSWSRPDAIVTNGPFELVEWRHRERLLVKRSPTYWDRAHVPARAIELLTVESIQTNFNLVLTGAAQWTDKNGIPNAFIADVLRGEAARIRPLELHRGPTLGTYFIRCNTTRPPLDDYRVRQALALAIDREAITRHVTRGGELPTSTLVPPGLSGYAGAVGLPHDPERARRLLREAGYPGGRGFPHLVYLFNTSESHRGIAEVLQAQWRRELGVEIELENQEFQVYLDNQKNLRYQLSRSSWIGDYPDPNTFLDLWVSGGGNNRTGFADAHYDSLIALAARQADPESRMRTLRDAEQLIVVEQLPVIPLYHYVALHLYDPRLRGVHDNVLDKMMLKYYYLDSSAPVTAEKQS